MFISVEVTGRVDLISLVRKHYIDNGIMLRKDAVCLRDAEVLEIAAKVIRNKIKTNDARICYNE